MARKRPAETRLSEAELAALREDLALAGKDVGVAPDFATPKKSDGLRRLSTKELRARRQSRAEVGDGTMTCFLDGDGVLRWRPGSAWQAAMPAGRRGLRRGAAFAGEVVDQFVFERLGLNDITTFLTGWDEKLTPDQGLRTLGDGGLAPFQPDGKPLKRVLLLIHGTFSNGENLAGALASVPDTDGQSFLEWARGKYDVILAFNHPTLSLPPLLNALRLESLLGDLPGKIDIVCHSRGGIVARWWYEVTCRRPERLGKVVFAGSPLAGTSLAAPDKVRDVIEYFTNVGRVLKYGLGAGSLFFPFLSVAQGLMSLVCSATSFLASVPLADAVIGLVPGFTAQSRVANNLELVELRNRARPMPQYYAITSDFRPTDPGWYFWRHFTRLNAASLAAGLIFPKPHDLVVDHEAMTELGRTPQGKEVLIPAAHRLDYGRNGKIHHVNYFSDLKSVQFLKKSLA